MSCLQTLEGSLKSASNQELAQKLRDSIVAFIDIARRAKCQPHEIAVLAAPMSEAVERLRRATA